MLVRIYSGLRDMVNVRGVLISRVGIFQLFCEVSGHGDIYISFLYVYVVTTLQCDAAV